jgi:transcriptional regulator with XRE-family HTH domain
MAEETMGHRLQRLRKDAGFSQSALARATGIPVTTIRGWEQDRRIPRIDSALKVARALGISLDELAGDGRADQTPKRARKGK